MDTPDARPSTTWSQFADEILPFVGLPPLLDRLASTCPTLPPQRIKHWHDVFNDANVELEDLCAELPEDWTSEDLDGLWYDRMKLISLACITEVERIQQQTGSQVHRRTDGEDLLSVPHP